jgi:glutaredoxin-related protein
LGGQFIPLMPVKIKGIVVTYRNNNSVEFILPSQRIETLKSWLTVMSEKQRVDFDLLVDIFRETDPNMRKQMEDAMNWLNSQLPELVAKSTVIEGIDIVKAYQSTLDLM